MVIAAACVIITGFIVITRQSGHVVGRNSRTNAGPSSTPVAPRIISPRPSPSASPNGETRTADCVPAPADTMTNTVSHLCGFPDTTNSGVPAGTTLINVPGQESRGQGWEYDDASGLVVTGDDAVIDGLNIKGGIQIKASNVTVENSVITETGDWWGIGLYSANNVTIEHCDISSPDATGARRLEVAIKDIHGDTIGSRIIDNNIWHASTAIQIANGIFAGNYIHDYGYNATDGDHLNGISVGGGDLHPLLIQNNTILDSYGQTDAIALFQDFGDEGNKTINNNLLAGGDYTIYAGGPDRSNGQCATYTGTSGCYGSSNNIVITNNRFSRMYFSTSGVFGPIALFNQLGRNNIWQHNVWDDTNGTISEPDGY